MKTQQVQKNEEQKVASVQTTKKLNALFMKPQITQDDMSKLTHEERDEFDKMLNFKLNNSPGLEKDKVLEQVNPLLSSQTNDDIWEAHHITILKCIHNHLSNTGIFPGKMQLAIETGLSRPTINKHYKEYLSHPSLEGQEEQFKMMKGCILSMLYKAAGNGNTGAAKLFLEQTGLLLEKSPKNQQYIQNQHNYIQINGVKLSQEEVQKLEPEKLLQIEAIIKNSANAIEGESAGA